MTDRPLLLVVEDDQGVRESLSMVLEFQDYDVMATDSGESGLTLVADRTPLVAILDVNLPGIDGVETCRRLRRSGFVGQVLMLTARGEVSDRVAGLDAGADDYLAKPFALDELLARVRAMIRRSANTPTPSETVGVDAPLLLDDLRIDLAARTVARGDDQLDLTKIEFDLLTLLVRNTDIVLPRDLIQERVWGYDDDLGSNSLEVFISSLRKKTEAGGGQRIIHTVRGVGYVARLAGDTT